MSARHAWRARKSLISRLYRRGRSTDAAAAAAALARKSEASEHEHERSRAESRQPNKSDATVDGAILAAIMMRLGGRVVGHLSLSRAWTLVAPRP
uniref:Uncharacterized protein n=1 Tax=Plectus sambesii TaxID=2011161 RepID=A0A914V4E9_9BILA